MTSDNFPAGNDVSQQVLSVSALNQNVARMLERNFPLLWVSGEISNFTRAASGHWYFTLKDEGAQVRAVMFRGRAQYAGFIPKEGDRIEVRALVTLYAPRGDYQLNVEAVRRAGLGNLYEAFLQLKEKLTREGLFDPARKRPLPAFARSVGIVTSLQAAALRDVLTALQRRAPHVRVVIYPAPVQGDGAAAKIAEAIRSASARAECDVLLVCRGGGSIEDLWSFNDEGVARAIVACAMPVISGVGHETDFTLADFAADLRAPTPTAAAELAATPRSDWLATLEANADDLTRALRRRLADTSQSVDWLSRRLTSPAALIRHERLKLQGWQTRLAHATRAPLTRARHGLTQASIRLSARLPQTAARRRQLLESARRIDSSMANLQAQRRLALAALAGQLELLNPQRTLERGYAMVTDARGNIVRAPTQVHPRENITLRLAQGVVEVGVASVQPGLVE
ncbi:exodeoxyribonuclease VII large subunit [Noviherbaspirillum sedimenti]|uniref:Exodeoxyribonuclease 7 large subunit n=1 Tax=Noviherbaspirillum sedimenti TaxID=2320865 RepID=A0A3A3G1S3_9BURK|nr:exodeoxyribonuclease VII large subunit [Noviherbaspirillum sedimenti]RJG01834.1 exodeoxyribonuclease VII large subunit [Noviherbaspirillum sedimenti]